MLDSLVIKNFRVFESLEVERLGRVNLIVGKNASGKTCWLDAMRVYAARGDIAILNSLVSEREEEKLARLVGEPSQRGPAYANHVFKNLFHGYRFPEKPEYCHRDRPAQRQELLADICRAVRL